MLKLIKDATYAVSHDILVHIKAQFIVFFGHSFDLHMSLFVEEEKGFYFVDIIVCTYIQIVLQKHEIATIDNAIKIDIQKFEAEFLLLSFFWVVKDVVHHVEIVTEVYSF